MFAPHVRLCTVNQYTTLSAPVAWRACETFVHHATSGMIVTEASDVFMLGCAFVEVLTGCSREPYDWLSGEALLLFRGNDATRGLNPLLVRRCSDVAAYDVLCGVILGRSAFTGAAALVVVCGP